MQRRTLNQNGLVRLELNPMEQVCDLAAYPLGVCQYGVQVLRVDGQQRLKRGELLRQNIGLPVCDGLRNSPSLIDRLKLCKCAGRSHSVRRNVR